MDPISLERFVELEGQIEKMRRLLLGGNAAGAVASLTLISMFVSRSETQTFPQSLFWILAVFVVGLLGGWTHLVSQTKEKIERQAQPSVYEDRPLIVAGPESSKGRYAAEDSKGEAWRLRVSSTILIQLIAISIASLCMVLGFIAGLWFLWTLTG